MPTTKLPRRTPAPDPRPILTLAADSLIARPAPDDHYQQRLCASVARMGILHPLTVRADRESGRFLVIDGARRRAAAISCKLSCLPCVLCTEADAPIRLCGSIFNQAEDLAALIAAHGWTQQDAAERMGVSQSTVANKLRLLRFSPDERQQIEQARLSERHARALLALPAEQRGEALARIAQGGLTVAATEALIEQMRPRRRAAIRDIGIFYNSIDRALSILHQAGIAATLDRRETDDGVRVEIFVSRET
ncbi:MAG: ParB N-terminal domain-containing protein [Clostridia bacterium]|nr:ParB N-terminal domain-containing protein [Clostridia bacterium]